MSLVYQKQAKQADTLHYPALPGTAPAVRSEELAHFAAAASSVAVLSTRHLAWPDEVAAKFMNQHTHKKTLCALRAKI